jgi:hypothetical protein
MSLLHYIPRYRSGFNIYENYVTYIKITYKLWLPWIISLITPYIISMLDSDNVLQILLQASRWSVNTANMILQIPWKKAKSYVNTPWLPWIISLITPYIISMLDSDWLIAVIFFYKFRPCIVNLHTPPKHDISV